MKFLIDENIPHSIIQFLKQNSQETIDVKNSELAGSSDNHLAKFALDQNAIILTFDKDFLGVKKTKSNLKCIFLSFRTLDLKHLEFSLKIILTKYKETLESQSFLITCREKEISIIL